MAKLEPALISSFSVNGSHEAIELWPPNVSNVELYAFMQSDLKKFFYALKEIPDEECPNALFVMAANWQCSNGCKTVADAINKDYAGKKIIGLTTFLPELTSLEANKEAWESAQHALCFLVSLCRNLQVLGHPISTIQIVGGSRTAGVELVDAKVRPQAYIVNRLNVEESIARLITRLRPIAEFAAKEPRIQIALELEPGPLFTVGETASLRSFCEQIEANPNDSLYQVVGVNLDIPHWSFLSGITTEWLKKKENDIIRNRIIHCHVSDHSNGHFGCHVIGVFHQNKQFDEWIKLVSELNALPKNPNRPNFSGFISCEMEGCKHQHFVQKCVNELIILIEKYNG